VAILPLTGQVGNSIVREARFLPTDAWPPLKGKEERLTQEAASPAFFGVVVLRVNIQAANLFSPPFRVLDVPS
jgi:hypothetical protein